ncbi:GNAT family N-acetyltransferase [Niastella vici]|nr:GNAT family N-acetyltransferase [Niastella vici]
MNTTADTQNELYKDVVPEVKNKIRLNDGYSIEVITGIAVIDLLLEPAFQQSWDMLYDCCPWGTVFQSRPFVTAWYRLYRDQHLPVLVKATERGQLKGLLPVVLLNAGDGGKGGKIAGAGHYEAQYQTWLAAPAESELFIKKALAALLKKFPAHPIAFRFLSPGTPLNWIKEDKQLNRYSIIQSYTRPLLNFNNPNHVNLFQRKHFKHKLNRLKKLGEVEFETINDYTKFESSLNEMTVLFDFRQSALFNKYPFRDDPAKKEFLLQLFRLNLLHVTVLNVDGKMMAAVVAVTGKDKWVHLAGINCHAPFNSRYYSPGYMNFVLLFKQLSAAGISCFDLTAGYDTYKEELANAHDEVKEWVISSQLKFRTKRKIKSKMHARLVAAGIRPMSVELNLKKFLYRVRHWRWSDPVKALVKKIQGKQIQKLYQVDTSTLSSVKISLHKDNLNDLLQFKQEKRVDITRWAFLSDAMHRFEDKQHCYTCTENGRLLCCAWFSFPDAVSTDKPEVPAPESAMVLERLYCNNTGKDRLLSFVKSMALEAANYTGRKTIQLLSADPLFCKTMNAAGF